MRDGPEVSKANLRNVRAPALAGLHMASFLATSRPSDLSRTSDSARPNMAPMWAHRSTEYLRAAEALPRVHLIPDCLAKHRYSSAPHDKVSTRPAGVSLSQSQHMLPRTRELPSGNQFKNKRVIFPHGILVSITPLMSRIRSSLVFLHIYIIPISYYFIFKLSIPRLNICIKTERVSSFFPLLCARLAILCARTSSASALCRVKTSMHIGIGLKDDVLVMACTRLIARQVNSNGYRVMICWLSESRTSAIDRFSQLLFLSRMLSTLPSPQSSSLTLFHLNCMPQTLHYNDCKLIFFLDWWDPYHCQALLHPGHGLDGLRHIKWQPPERYSSSYRCHKNSVKMMGIYIFEFWNVLIIFIRVFGVFGCD
ncbi:hypothetical protein VP01_3970g1 [Puccinia sorghi]|uniref:Uncharacterized protein n=1 Tax=Puccinia sorghi TaxID=27349 RepID=A0A0L6US90_9BASI|nr:hypothetical protein VP01_3970g1 [Puccinia sorghi]